MKGLNLGKLVHFFSNLFYTTNSEYIKFKIY